MNLTPCFLLILLVLFPPFVTSASSYQASFVPWSGYWWPVIRGGLSTGLEYRGHPAPLEKYHLLTTGETTGEALEEYEKRYYDPDAPGWFGLCAYWAYAACCEHMDILPSSEENLIFRVGDKKGLLTLAHSRDLPVVEDGSLPEVFHEWLLRYIKDQKKAFVFDRDPGEEVWSFPVYRYDMTIVKIPGEDKKSVSVTVYYANDSVPPDYNGTYTLGSDYNYELFVNADGDITGGQWTGGSVDNHPDLLSFSPGAWRNFPGLDYQEVKRLAESKDDFLERGSQSVEICPGTYNLVLLDEDVYTISAKSGDILSLRIGKETGSLQDVAVVVTDGNENVVEEALLSEDSVMDVFFNAATPPYTIRLTQDDYTDPNIYVLTADLKKSFNQEVPYIPNSNVWSGFALTNPGTTAVEEVLLTTRDAEGVPLRTVLGPLQLNPGEKKVFFFSDLPVRITELYKAEGLTLTADGPVDLLNLIGEGDSFLTTFVQGDARGSRLVIPDTAARMTPGVRMFGGVRNESFEEAEVSLRLYYADGRLMKEVTETIAAQQWLSLKPGDYPFYNMPESGWIEIEGNREQTLSGFQYTSNSSGVETLFALPVGAAKKIVPHIAEFDQWATKVTLINPRDTKNPVNLHLALAGADTTRDKNIELAPREKRVLDVQELFGKMAGTGDPLYHSILEIKGHYPLVGYFTYSVPDGNDNASYPLLDDSFFKSVLSLPHYADDISNWWTGAVVCNPSTVAETVRIEPYDHDGKLMEGYVQSVNLPAGKYDVFDVTSRFRESESAISFIRFRTEGDSGAIGGFYLYGDHGNHILSGANMQ